MDARLIFICRERIYSYRLSCRPHDPQITTRSKLHVFYEVDELVGRPQMRDGWIVEDVLDFLL